MEKGVVECEIFGEIFGGFNPFLGTLGKGKMHFFLGGNPKKRESGDLRLLWFFQEFFRRQALEKGIRRFEIALRFFSFFSGGKPLKRESGDLRLL